MVDGQIIWSNNGQIERSNNGGQTMRRAGGRGGGGAKRADERIAGPTDGQTMVKVRSNDGQKMVK